ncbi:hypothetical protein DPMN_111087 [Dreissena polymorpha]|uniref:Uncharacterized protein n=1 Tax=Dreissena polymorpha TaxID=45954 RepID=A0A9D4KEE1_DREPO|nr:hypothetical protein DPMN_111087 [Dreissena polymorpha]
MQRCQTDNERQEALKSQLRFRKGVLKQKYRDSKVFNFTQRSDIGKYTPLSVEELTQNLQTLIKDCLLETTQEKQNEGVP